MNIEVPSFVEMMMLNIRGEPFKDAERRAQYTRTHFPAPLILLAGLQHTLHAMIMLEY